MGTPLPKPLANASDAVTEAAVEDVFGTRILLVDGPRLSTERITGLTMGDDAPLVSAVVYRGNPVREPITCTMHCHDDNQPLKTKLAERFPLMSRRDRRAIMRKAKKLAPAVTKPTNQE